MRFVFARQRHRRAALWRCLALRLVGAASLASLSCDTPANVPSTAGGDLTPEDLTPLDVGPLPDVGHPWTDEEIVAVLLRDSDGDRTSDLDELAAGTDPLDPTEGDLDGDGIENKVDRDVDGDGKDNADDDDIDGDGIEDGDDDDPDGDGLEEDEDDDDDGDGEDDSEDDDDDGDGESDCGCKHGKCDILAFGCICDKGWEGEKCEKPHCHDIGDCNHGKCIDVDKCECEDGWADDGADRCKKPLCTGKGNCNGHGKCTAPDTCKCDTDWQGDDQCSKQTCVTNSSVLCDDSDPCTDDTCDPQSGCKHADKTCPAGEKCVEGSCAKICTNSSVCADEQACRDGTCSDECQDDAECRDGDPCTADGCEPVTHKCSHIEQPCAVFDKVCSFGKCVAPCAGDDECVEDLERCDGVGCQKACDNDDSVCGNDESCTGGVCIPDNQEEDPEDEDDGP